MALQVASDDNLAHILKENRFLLVEFGATWCPPCRVLAPILEEISEEMGEKISVIQIDSDESPASATAYGVMSLPTVIAFKDGTPVDKLVGLRPKGVYLNVISKMQQ